MFYKYFTNDKLIIENIIISISFSGVWSTLTSGIRNKLSSLELAIDKVDPESPMMMGMLGEEHTPELLLFLGWETTDNAVLWDNVVSPHVSYSL